jgi:hypothetical protein
MPSAGFQSVIYTKQPLGFPGGTAANSISVGAVPPVEAGWVAGIGGTTIGAWGWGDANGTVLNSGAGAPTGFLLRGNNALITAFGAEAGSNVPRGFIVQPMVAGTFYAVTLTAAVPGHKVFARLSDGASYTAPAGTVVAGYVETRFAVANTAAVGELITMTTWY